MKTMLTTVCIMSAMCAVGAVKKQPAKKTSLSESELRTMATAEPSVKNASALYSVAMVTANNVERKQAYLKAAAACLIACGKNDVYKKHVKGKLQGSKEFEDELKDDCKQCSGSGTKERRCYECSGSGRCSRCKGAGQTVRVGFDGNNTEKTCGTCKGSGSCLKCRGEGALKEKCTTCAGTGKAFSKAIAAQAFRDSCIAIADDMKTVVISRDEAHNPQKNVDKEHMSHRQSRQTEGHRNSSASSAKPIQNGFGTETVDGVIYSYKVENGVATIGVGRGFTAAVENEPEGTLVVPSKLGGAPVVKIGFAAFNCTKSSRIILPDGVVAIEDKAFYDAKVSRIVLPSSIRIVGAYVLDKSTWFENQKDGPLYLDNVLLGFKSSTHNSFSGIKEEKHAPSMKGSFVVKAGTRVIANGAFLNGGFNEVILPDSLSYIGENAFQRCMKLTRITIPKHLIAIGNGAFYGCEALAIELVFPECTRKIGDRAFSGCLNIENVTFPLSIEAIGRAAFNRCPLKTIALPPLLASSNNRFQIPFEIPRTIESVQLIGEWTHIPEKMFRHGKNLKKIILLEGIKEIGAGAFECCESLEEVQIPDTVVQIGNSAFSGCSKLRHVKLPRQLKDIGESLFSRCTSLESVVIPSGVTNIENFAFSDCPSLKSISIPDSVDAISDHAFDETCRLEKSEKRRRADQLAAVGAAEDLFAKRCEAGNGVARINYEGVLYAIVKNIAGGENFVVEIDSPRSSDLAGSFVIFPTSDSRDRWYAAVRKCVEKVRSWVQVAAENRVEQVCKEIPIYDGGRSDKVYAYVNAISRGRGAAELFWKTIREEITPLMATQLVKFTGSVSAKRDDFSRYRVAIEMTCGNSFGGTIFHANGTIEEIDKEIVEFLTFVNPKSLKSACEKQSEKEALFN